MLTLLLFVNYDAYSVIYAMYAFPEIQTYQSRDEGQGEMLK